MLGRLSEALVSLDYIKNHPGNVAAFQLGFSAFDSSLKLPDETRRGPVDVVDYTTSQVLGDFVAKVVSTTKRWWMVVVWLTTWPG